MRNGRAFISLLLFMLLAFPAFGFETIRNLSLPADGIAKLRIDAGAGFLKVVGRDGLAEIHVTAEIVVSGVEEKDVDAYIKNHGQLELRKSGDTALLTAGFHDAVSLFAVKSGHIDLTVTVPRALALEIKDGSGKLSVADIAADVRIDDGTGSLKVARVKGNVRIDDGEGDLSVDEVEGNVDIVDDAGDIDVRNVTGDVSLLDGSGGITLVKIGGRVTVDDTSGILAIKDVGKDVILKQKGKGTVDITDVKGKIIR